MLLVHYHHTLIFLSDQLQMGRLPFPPDAELTGPDRVVLSILQKEFELHKDVPSKVAADLADDSDDSTAKRSEFVSPSPEGKRYRTCNEKSLSKYQEIGNLTSYANDS